MATPDATPESPNLNTSVPWSDMDLLDLRLCAEAEDTLEDAAKIICRTQQEVREKAAELGLDLRFSHAD